MRVWIESTCNYLRDEEHVQVGVVSYRHKREEWKGFTVSFFLFNWGFSFNAVTNYPEYDRIVHWWKPEHKAARAQKQEERRVRRAKIRVENEALKKLNS